MECEYADHCMRILTRSFFPTEACIVIGHVLTLRERGGVRTITEGPLIKACGIGEHRVRRVLGAYARHGLIRKLEPPRGARVALRLTFPRAPPEQRGARCSRRVAFAGLVASVVARRGELLEGREGKLGQRWSMDVRQNMLTLEGKMRRMDQMYASRPACPCSRGGTMVVPDASGGASCFVCGSPIQEAEEGDTAPWDLDVREAMDYALGHRCPSIAYADALRPAFEPPDRLRAPDDDGGSDDGGSDDDDGVWDDDDGNGWDDDGESEAEVHVRGVPKPIHDVTEEDQDLMTREEFHAFWSLAHRPHGDGKTA